MWKHPNYYKNLRKLYRSRNRDQAISDQAATADGERAPGTGPKIQLKKLVAVHKVAEFKREDKNVIFKEMALFKFVANNGNLNKAFEACKNFNPEILDKTNKSIVIQITALRREIDKIAKNLKKLGLVSISRTGAVAMTRGDIVFN